MYIFKFYKFYPRIANVMPCSKTVYLLQNCCNLDLLGAQSMYEINTCHVLIVEAWHSHCTGSSGHGPEAYLTLLLHIWW